MSFRYSKINFVPIVFKLGCTLLTLRCSFLLTEETSLKLIKNCSQPVNIDNKQTNLKELPVKQFGSCSAFVSLCMFLFSPDKVDIFHGKKTILTNHQLYNKLYARPSHCAESCCSKDQQLENTSQTDHKLY